MWYSFPDLMDLVLPLRYLVWKNSHMFSCFTFVSVNREFHIFHQPSYPIQMNLHWMADLLNQTLFFDIGGLYCMSTMNVRTIHPAPHCPPPLLVPLYLGNLHWCHHHIHLVAQFKLDIFLIFCQPKYSYNGGSGKWVICKRVRPSNLRWIQRTRETITAKTSCSIL